MIKTTAFNRRLEIVNELVDLGILNAKPAEHWVTNASMMRPESADGEVWVSGPIVDPSFARVFESYGLQDYTTAHGFRNRLNEIEGPVTVRFNSPGGDVWEGSAIRNAVIEARRNGVEMRGSVEGLVASAATLPLMALRDVTTFADMSDMMIHRVSTGAYGNADVMGATLEAVNKKDEQLADMYSELDLGERTATEAMIGKHRDGTWFTPAEAVAAGAGIEVMKGVEKAPEKSAEAPAAVNAVLHVDAKLKGVGIQADGNGGLTYAALMKPADDVIDSSPMAGLATRLRMRLAANRNLNGGRNDD